MEKSESIAFVMEDYCSELCNVLQTNGYTVTLGWKQWEEVKISVCYDYIGRIMNNLLSNLLKYADKTKEILLDMGICQDEFFFSIMNPFLSFPCIFLLYNYEVPNTWSKIAQSYSTSL